MSNRKNSIRWKQSDYEKLKKEIERFNRKVSRATKKHPDLKDILPSKKSYKDIKKNIATRNDLKRELKSIDRFFKKDALKVIENNNGLKLTNYEYKETLIRVRKINRDREKERKSILELDAKSRGEDLGMKRGQMASERADDFLPKKFNFNKMISFDEWEMYKQAVERQAYDSYLLWRKDIFKANYIKALDLVFGDNASDIKKAIQNMSEIDFYETFKSDQEATIEFIYYDATEYWAKIEYLKGVWCI